MLTVAKMPGEGVQDVDVLAICLAIHLSAFVFPWAAQNKFEVGNSLPPIDFASHLAGFVATENDRFLQARPDL